MAIGIAEHVVKKITNTENKSAAKHATKNCTGMKT